MAEPGHSLDGDSAPLALARAKLRSPVRRASLWPLVAAAALAAAGALSFAAVVILGPPIAATRGAQADVNPWVR